MSTTKWSGFTAPDTTASPSPGLASTTASRRLPVTGFAVNSTPATADCTISCTTTASRTTSWSIPLLSRYATARSVHNDAQHRRTASSTASAPTTFRNVSCCPAKLANGRSSAVADDRTATGVATPNRSYPATTASRTSPGISAASNSSRAFAGSPLTPPTLSATRRYASVITQNPSGTGSPARVSSPRFAALPPTSASMRASIAVKSRMSRSSRRVSMARRLRGFDGKFNGC